MSSEQCPYSVVQPNKIGESIAALYTSLRKDGKTYTRSGSANVIVLSSAPSQNQTVDALIETLAIVHPSRFFTVVPDNAAPGITVELSCRVVPVSKSEFACSDVIRITAPENRMDSVAEILRAQFLSGMPIELCLFDPKVPYPLIQRMGPVSDVMLFDSAVYDARPEVLSWIAKSPTHDVDVQWLLLAPWRDEIRRVFDRPASSAALCKLSGIQIEVQGPDPDSVPACAFLLAGWIADRCHLKVVASAKGGKTMLKGPDRREIALGFSRRGVAGDAAIVSVRMACGDRGEVTITREGTSLEANIRIEPAYHASHPIEEEGRDAALRRHFLIGESIANYPASFRLGLSLR